MMQLGGVSAPGTPFFRFKASGYSLNQYSRATIFLGLPLYLTKHIAELLDNAMNLSFLTRLHTYLFTVFVDNSGWLKMVDKAKII